LTKKPQFSFESYDVPANAGQFVVSQVAWPKPTLKKSVAKHQKATIALSSLFRNEPMKMECKTK
jgi:hypothetical protein